MTVRVYKSTDAGAPALTGTTAGSLIAILDACLVNGYGSKAPVGWLKAFSGTNKAVYRSPVGTNQFYYRVDDTATGSSRAARLVGFENATSVDVGTGQFPLNTQVTGGLYLPTVQGSNAGVGRPWFVVATEKFVHVYLHCDDQYNNQYRTYMAMGDYISYKLGGDPYSSILLAQVNATVPTSQAYGYELQSSLSAVMEGLYTPRPYTGLGTSYQMGRHSDSIKGGSTLGSGSLPYPHPVDGGLYLAPVWLHQYVGNQGSVVGEMPGLWNCLHANAFQSGDEWDGTGPLAGKRFLGLRSGSAGMVLEISDTW